MKLGIFTDSHYCLAERLCETRRPSLSIKKMKEAMDYFLKEKVDLCVCLGDFTDHAPKDTKESVVACFSQALELIRSYGIPFYLVPGNHDYLMMKGAELEDFGIKLPPYIIETPEKSIIVLDANYRDNEKRFDEAGVDWTDSNLPKTQCEFLMKTLIQARQECVIMIHECLDPYVEEHHIVKNAAEIRKILTDSGKVKKVLQGHYHPGAEHEIDGISYTTLPAMCEGEGNYYVVMEL